MSMGTRYWWWWRDLRTIYLHNNIKNSILSLLDLWPYLSLPLTAPTNRIGISFQLRLVKVIWTIIISIIKMDNLGFHKIWRRKVLCVNQGIISRIRRKLWKRGLVIQNFHTKIFILKVKASYLQIIGLARVSVKNNHKRCRNSTLNTWSEIQSNPCCKDTLRDQDSYPYTKVIFKDLYMW